MHLVKLSCKKKIARVSYTGMLYIFVFATIALFTGLYFLAKRVWPNQHHAVEKTCSLIFAAFFLIRFFSTRNIQTIDWHYATFEHFGGFQNGFLNFVGNMLLWLETTAAMFLILRPFFRFKTSIWYTKYFAFIIFSLSLVGIYPMLSMIQGSYDFTFTGVMLAIEVGTGFALCLYYFLTGLKKHISKHSYVEVGVATVLINFATMPSFIPYFFFGLGNVNNHVFDMSIFHRVFIYILLIVLPLSIYFSLRNASPNKIRFFLMIIAFGTTLEYFSKGDWTDLVQPWYLPFHLCNLAMVLICIVLIFKPKRLFYFTYFINVFGAILAMLMPNYDEFLRVFDPTVIHFWCNHMIAFWMPLLCVALKLYERPKMKQYFYSTVGFLGYFILVFVLNTVFTAYEGTVVHYLGHDFTIRGTDYFFINSTFIAEKLGDWAESIFNITYTITLNGRPFTIHPIYQAIYFTVYALIGFGVWFVYQLFFDIADSHYDLHLRLRGIRLDKIALQSQLDGRSLDEPMDKDAGIQLKLDHFSKKYGTNNYYSVEDANFEVHAGEVFGFLGPNGAGKSTIIKSIVGIQPITEGNIFVCGYNVKSQAVHAKSQIGFVPDHYALYEKLTGREYLNYIADIYDVSQEDRDARLNEYIKLFELEASIDNKIKTYSHGMKQKITIMSALVHDPKVWILDEPLTGLDPTSIFQVKEQMKKHAKKGNIVFFSSHLIDIVEKLCDRIAIIKKGHIQCVVTVEEIEKSGQTLEDFYLSVISK